MKLFEWTVGRQEECEYQKFCFLWSKIWRLGFDGYILKYEPHAKLPLHTDPVPGGKHYRLNIIFKRTDDINYIQGKPIIDWFNHRIVLFRPDIQPHSMSNGDGIRKVLSLGFLWIDKKK